MSQHVLAEDLTSVRHCPTCLAIYRSEFTRCPVDGAHIIVSDCDPMIGVTVAEHYQIDELLGIGSSGRVYLAHHRRLAQRRFALKILFGDLAATASARMRFTHEAESASRLAHPNLVSVVDFGKTPAGLLYLAMDYIEGPTLASLLEKQGAMPQDRAVRMAIQLCRGLAHAHDLGLIHRDFKPDNILVSSDAHGDVPRIVDFGIALSADDGDPRLTATGVTLGTPAYAAPEQTTDGEVDHRADLFALGVTLYEMLAGVLPFEGTMVEIMRQNATLDPPTFFERAPQVQVTPALAHVVFRLMARDPAQRYQTAREALEALTELPRRAAGAAPSRPSSTVIPSLLPIASSTADRAGARTTAMAARASTPPSLTPVPGSGPHSVPSARLSSPVLQRQSSPVIAAHGRSSSASIPAGRPSTPLLTGIGSGPTKAGAPSGPLVIPSSTQLRAPTTAEGPAVRESSVRLHAELPPLITPVARRRYGAWAVFGAMLAAAVFTIVAMIVYQRFSKQGSAPPPAAQRTGAAGDRLGEAPERVPAAAPVPAAPAAAPVSDPVPAATAAPAVAPSSSAPPPTTSPSAQAAPAATAAGRKRAAPRRKPARGDLSAL